MADDRLREAERVFRETGSVEDEARLLTERVRAGQLAPERLDLAAELRYEPAVLATGGPTGPRSHLLHEVVEALERFGREATVRALVVAARRSGPVRPDLEATDDCLGAIEAWLACPCEAHGAAMEPFITRNAHRYAHTAVRFALGNVPVRSVLLAPVAYAFTANLAESPTDAVLVAAIRRELTRWALAPHEPRERRSATLGSLLDVRVGCWPWSDTQRLLVAAERTSFGGGRACTVHLDRAPGGAVEIVRTAGHFQVRVLRNDFPVFLNDGAPAEGPLATGDVISIANTWLEVRVLDAPFEEDVESACADADWLVRAGADKTHIEVASMFGHLGAVLAAPRLGVTVRPRFTDADRFVVLRGLPPKTGVAVLVAVMGEVLPIWKKALPQDDVFERTIEHASAWLRGPSAASNAAALRLRRELSTVLERHQEQRIRSAVLLAVGCLDSMRQGELGIREIEQAAGAGVPHERVWAVVREEVVAWALAP